MFYPQFPILTYTNCG